MQLQSICKLLKAIEKAAANMGNTNSRTRTPSYILETRVEKPMSNFVEKLIKFGDDKVKEALDEVTHGAAVPKPPVPRPTPILKNYEKWELHELGLGRGVNGTEPRPWVNKASFQVREAIMSGDDLNSTNLIATNEGGMLRDYVEEVTSIKDQTAKMDFSITVPNAPVSVGVGADLSRTWTNTQKAIGRRVLSTTIAFQQLFDKSDENVLAKYVLECSDPSIEKDKDWIGTLTEMNDQDCKKCQKCFERFLASYNVTHYVSAITLGASMFIVETESDYQQTISPHGKLEYEPIASLEASATFSKKLKHSSKDIKYIGKLSGEDMSTVEKEAVINVQLQPITNLIQNECLRESLKDTLRLYTQKQKQNTVGPYLISCNDSKIFLTADLDPEEADPERAHRRVYGVKEKNKASEFYIILTDDGDHAHEFYIGWKSDDRDGTMRYLCAPVSVSGCHAGPLYLESHGKKSHSLFSINNQLTLPFYRLRGHSDVNVNPKAWFKGQDSYLIRCTKRMFRVDGFLAVRRDEGDTYRMITKRDASSHHNEDVHMAFRIHRTIEEDEEGVSIPDSAGSSISRREGNEAT